MMTDRISLEEYVEKVCLQIVNGVRNAQKNVEVGNHIGAINYDRGEQTVDKNGSPLTTIEFDVFTEVNANKGGDAGVSILSIKAGGKIENSSSVANRVKFTIPISIPTAPMKKE